MNAVSYRAGLKAGVPIGLGYLSVSFAFGMMAQSVGLPIWVAVLISMTNLTSAGQLAGLTLIASGAGFLEMVLTQFIINLRYALMSLSLSQKLHRSVTLLDRMCIAFGNTDEIFALASSTPGELGKRYLYGLITIPYIGWALGTWLGAVAGELLPATVTSALGIAIYAMFLAIIVPPAKKYRPILKVILCAVLLSCLFRWVPGLNRLSAGFVIILCALLAAGLGAFLFPLQEERGNERA